MAKIYAAQIRKGSITLENVPEKWRGEVSKLLEEKEKGRNTMDTPITRAEHEEFRKRIEEENKRQNCRINKLEDTFEKINSLATSTEKLATSMEAMLKEQEEQGGRLKILEERDGEKWRKVVGYIVTAVVGIVVGFIFTQIGIGG